MAGNAELMVALGAVVFVGFAASFVFERLRVPDLVLLLAVGILLGPLTGLVPRESLAAVAGPLSTIALVVILFEGGLDLDWLVLRRQLGVTSVLLLLSFVLTALALAAIGVYFAGLPVGAAALLGLASAPLASSVLIPLLGRLRVLPRTKAILTIESAMGDVLAVVSVTVLASALAAGPSGSGPLLAEMAGGFVSGALLAAAAGVGWLFALRYLKGRPYAYMVTFAAALLLYGIVESQRGSGVFAVLVFALVLGNAHHVTRRLPGFEPANLDDRIRWFHAEMSFVVRTFFFVYLGTSLAFENLDASFFLVTSAMLAAVLAVRLLVVGAVVRLTPEERADASYLAFLVPRGLASAALAGSPAVLAVAGGVAVELVGALVLLTNLAMTAFVLVRERGAGAGADPEAAGTPADWTVARKLEKTAADVDNNP